LGVEYNVGELLRAAAGDGYGAWVTVWPVGEFTVVARAYQDSQPEIDAYVTRDLHVAYDKYREALTSEGQDGDVFDSELWEDFCPADLVR
jgi:hypothetical protein